jgi:hypothetical protein
MIFPVPRESGKARKGVASRTILRRIREAAKRQARNFDPGEEARKRVAAPGERKVVSSCRLRLNAGWLPPEH